jgi:hypothetical protein
MLAKGFQQVVVLPPFPQTTIAETTIALYFFCENQLFIWQTKKKPTFVWQTFRTPRLLSTILVDPYIDRKLSARRLRRLFYMGGRGALLQLDLVGIWSTMAFTYISRRPKVHSFTQEEDIAAHVQASL